MRGWFCAAQVRAARVGATSHLVYLSNRIASVCWKHMHDKGAPRIIQLPFLGSSPDLSSEWKLHFNIEYVWYYETLLISCRWMWHGQLHQLFIWGVLTETANKLGLQLWYMIHDESELSQLYCRLTWRPPPASPCLAGRGRWCLVEICSGRAGVAREDKMGDDGIEEHERMGKFE